MFTFNVASLSGCRLRRRIVAWVMVLALASLHVSIVRADDALTWPPELPGGQAIVTDTASEFVTVPEGTELREDTLVAEIPPTIDFMYFPGQTYRGRPWSVWGDGLGVDNHLYYTAIGDHLAPQGTAQLYEYNTETRELRMLVDIKTFLEESGVLNEQMRYSPAKIHSRIDLGRDGWLYYSTHRGSVRRGTDDEHGYEGDWIFRTHIDTGETEIVAAHPVEKHVIPASVTDPERLIFYGGTAHGRDAELRGVQFFAWDIENAQLLIREPDGFNRYAIFSDTTGRVFWQGADSREGRMYDPETNEITASPNVPHVRSATRETSGGIVYGTSHRDADIWAFNTDTQELTDIGYGVSGDLSYITAMEIDPATERYLYYVAGAHGRIIDEGTPIMQYDLVENTRKVIAFVGPYYRDTYGYTPDGTFGIGISDDGATLYVTWNGNRRGGSGSGRWDTCALMVVHIPETERQP